MSNLQSKVTQSSVQETDNNRSLGNQHPQKSGQQTVHVEQPTQPASSASSNKGQGMTAKVAQHEQRTEKAAVSSNAFQEKQSPKAKRTRHRLSKKEQHDLAASAAKLLNSGFSIKATANELSFPKERIFSILEKCNLLDEVDFRFPTVFCIDELKQFFQKKFGAAPLVEIRKEDEGFRITKHKNNVKGENNE